MERWSWTAAALGLSLGCVPVGAPDDGPAASDGSSTDQSDDPDMGDSADASGDCGPSCATDGADDESGGELDTGAGPESDCSDNQDNDQDQQVDCDDPDCDGQAGCGDRTIRLATWNTLRVGPQGSEQYDALADILRRIDADVVCVQEVGEGEEPQLDALADELGYGYGLLAPASGVPGAGIANACMSRVEVIDASYLWADWISPDPNARDLTRPYVRLRLYHEGADRYISVLSGHLKAGGDDVDRFRRMVDSIRLGQAAASERNEYPGNAVVALGDLNEEPNPTSSTFSSLPAGLPEFYNLGNDIALPITYAPSDPLAAAGLSRVEARWEDGTEEATFIPFESRLDYIWVSDETVLASEVYEACRDDGVDADPAGDVLPKAGEPLPCGLSEVASDHRPVVVDLHLQ